MRRRAVLAAPALLLCAAAARDPLAGRVAGPDSPCIDLRGDESPVVAGARVLLYPESGRRVWRTEPDGICRGFVPFTTVITQDNPRHLCRGDLFRVRDPSDPVPSPTCRFGPFVPYDRPAGHR